MCDNFRIVLCKVLNIPTVRNGNDNFDVLHRVRIVVCIQGIF